MDDHTKALVVSEQRLSDRLIHKVLLSTNVAGHQYLTLNVFYDGITYLLSYFYENNIDGIKLLLQQSEELNTNEKAEKAIGPAIEM